MFLFEYFEGSVNKSINQISAIILGFIIILLINLIILKMLVIIFIIFVV